MRASNLPSLRGRISSSHALRIEAAKAISAAEVAARRASIGYAQAGTDLASFFESARAAAVKGGRADSISVTPATDTLAAAETQQLAVEATWLAVPAGTPTVTADVTGDGRCVYTTSDATKATVSSSGLITAVATGSATITATFHGRTDTCVVTVS